MTNTVMVCNSASQTGLWPTWWVVTRCWGGSQVGAICPLFGSKFEPNGHNQRALLGFYPSLTATAMSYLPGTASRGLCGPQKWLQKWLRSHFRFCKCNQKWPRSYCWSHFYAPQDPLVAVSGQHDVGAAAEGGSWCHPPNPWEWGALWPW